MIRNPDKPFSINIDRDGTDKGLPIIGLSLLSAIIITSEVADSYNSWTVSNLLVHACSGESKYTSSLSVHGN